MKNMNCCHCCGLVRNSRDCCLTGKNRYIVIFTEGWNSNRADSPEESLAKAKLAYERLGIKVVSVELHTEKRETSLMGLWD